MVPCAHNREFFKNQLLLKTFLKALHGWWEIDRLNCIVRLVKVARKLKNILLLLSHGATKGRCSYQWSWEER